MFSQPERLSGNDYTIRSDVWSTGISLLELVTNRFPFPTDLAAIELMMYIVQNEVCDRILVSRCRYTELRSLMYFSRVGVVFSRPVAAGAGRRGRDCVQLRHEGLHQENVSLCSGFLYRVSLIASLAGVQTYTRPIGSSIAQGDVGASVDRQHNAA